MEEDLRKYKLQLQQVEAALTTYPTNDELIKLKADLQEVIELTQDLLQAQKEEAVAKKTASTAPKGPAALLQAQQEEANRLRRRKWKVGDRCLAKRTEDGQYYEAVIHELVENIAKVLFPDFNQLQTSHVDDFRDLPISAGGKKPTYDDIEDERKQNKTPYSRDYLKKKKQKKQQRFKQIEEERESEKNKWLSFAAKSSKKSGLKGKSIFASPDNVNGRVGIGTCGISGRPMTEFSHGEMWRKGT